MADALLEVDDLTVQYETPDGYLTAASNVSFSIEPGEYFGLVGESGCGKSTIAKAILGGLDSNGRIADGTIRFQGREIQDLSDRELSEDVRWQGISWIPQGSMSSLDPMRTIRSQAVEIGQTHTDMTEAAITEKFSEMFEVVGLPTERIDDYAHQFSGGMQQRALIALALFLEPSLIVADEPTTALDVIMQDQIFKYLDRIRDEIDASMLMITHDISLVFESCDSMAVMHGGQVAESGSVDAVYNNPRHPYAFMLQDAFPDIRDTDRTLQEIPGEPPQSYGAVTECTFADRCPYAVDECRNGAPPLERIDDPERADGKSHLAACVRSDEAYEEYDAEAGQAHGGQRQ
ncbi:ABC transporter ATP-binding protein [Halorubellus sp. JP-L1]|uniref:ABC transporter ATP-binding protein n=1 Tax=Halorubellus sp. JP-L1 TaxID=2715753 RepID=UPI00140AB438|nr:ABC transporter ATP-binding protein [Halorubellus sp. JP-L1]NHN42922.1 ABC transporter ATP-binding protein [Halorubellus sp. JP-L1]